MMLDAEHPRAHFVLSFEGGLGDKVSGKLQGQYPIRGIATGEQAQLGSHLPEHMGVITPVSKNWNI